MRACLAVLVTCGLATLSAACTSTPDLDALTAPRYEVGHQRGAKFCATCHEDIYKQWSRRSRHAQATTSPSFRHAVAELEQNVALSRRFDDAMCYACHGSKTRNEGVNCETCHGRPLPGVSIETTHDKKFTPRLAAMRNPGFCAKCHQVRTPITGDDFTTLYKEWQASKAAARGVTCQRCHMARRADDAHAYHGFDSGYRNVAIYRDDLRLTNIVLDAPSLRLTVENHVQGHAIPASGPTRILALEISLRDAAGRQLHDQHHKFFKRFSMLPIVGGAPLWMTDNNQLQSGEKRRLRFDLPAAELARAAELVILLHMYEVADKHAGDIKKAHWTSKPIVRKVLPTNVAASRIARRF